MKLLLSRGITAVLVIAALTGCQKDYSRGGLDRNNHKLTIKFVAAAAGNPLTFGDVYVNAFNEPYSVSTFKFYVYAPTIETPAGKSSALESFYHLIDLSNPATSQIIVTIPPGAAKAVSFKLGVDSVHNVSGAQTDALDPGHGMFWTWSTGYIMAKLEGHSPVAKTPSQVFEYHIGGFKSDQSVIKDIVVPLYQTIQMERGKKSTFIISADVHSWFSGPNQIRLSEHPVCMTPGTLAKLIADNYSQMFALESIEED